MPPDDDAIRADTVTISLSMADEVASVRSARQASLRPIRAEQADGRCESSRALQEMSLGFEAGRRAEQYEAITFGDEVRHALHL